MNRFVFTGLALVAIMAAGAGGFWLGTQGMTIPGFLPTAFASRNAPASPIGELIYYRDPDGPFYSGSPKNNPAGRAYLPVRASEDTSFAPPPKIENTDTAKEPRKIRFYRNPMGLPDTSPVPKKDSMGMDYLPVYEGEDDESGIVKVSPGKLQRTGVQSELVELRVVTRPVRAPGIVKFDERRISVISLRSQSFIEKVEDITTGETVRANQPLFSLYSPEISAASAQYLSVLESPPGGTNRALTVDGARRRLENLDVPGDVIADIERSRKVPNSIVWKTLRDGIVLERSAVDGMRAMPGEVLFKVADLSLMWVLADVPEADLARVSIGQPVIIRLRALPGKIFEGRVSLIYPQVNMETRSTRVRIELANPERRLRADMFAEIEFGSKGQAPVLAVPDSALIDTGMRQTVILDHGEGRFEPREVEVGVRGNGYIEIRKGVKYGDRVVISANFLIDAESNLKAALQGLEAATPKEKTP
jgi:membrane fusion protein, copper/silver efflux system